MAVPVLDYSWLKCPLCGEQFKAGEFVFSTSFYNLGHPVFRRLDDAHMHQECLRNWSRRDEFIAYWNSVMIERGDHDFLCIKPDGQVAGCADAREAAAQVVRDQAHRLGMPWGGRVEVVPRFRLSRRSS